MRRFFRKKTGSSNPTQVDNPHEPQDLSQKLHAAEEQRRLYLSAIQMLAGLLKQASPEIQELSPESYRERIDRLFDAISSNQAPKKLESYLDAEKEGLSTHIKRQKNHLKDRETEYRDIISLLTKGMAGLNVENETFNRKFYKQSEKIEKITLLGDIKAIKGALNQEIDQMRVILAEKRSRETQQIESLSKQVTELQSELEKARQNSLRDELTGAFTVQAFDRYLKSIVEKNETTPAPFSMSVLDIDDYAKIREAYGRQIADRAVLAIAQACSRFLRSDDFLARYRNGTFIIIHPGEPLKQVLKKAKRLCSAIAAYTYYVDDSLHGHRFSFTVSIGVSAYRKGDSVASVTGRAVRALCAAKSAGKNRVVTEQSRFLVFRRGGVDTIEDL